MSVERQFRKFFGDIGFESLKKTIKKHLFVSPIVVFVGDTGAGKSSLCNALFGKKLFPVGHFKPTTKMVRAEQLKIESRTITLVDTPGIGENKEETAKYCNLYENLCKYGISDNQLTPRSVDVFVFVIQADCRALEGLLTIYKDIFKKTNSDSKIVFVLSQIEKTAPLRDWNFKENKPGARQSKIIHNKIRHVSEEFGINPENITPVSADERYNLSNLLENIVFAAPTKRSMAIAIHAEKNTSNSMSKKSKSVLIKGLFFGSPKSTKKDPPMSPDIKDDNDPASNDETGSVEPVEGPVIEAPEELDVAGKEGFWEWLSSKCEDFWNFLTTLL